MLSTMPSDLNAIFDDLYLGSMEAALHTDTLKELGITHILTIDDRPLLQEITCHFSCKYVHGLDLQDTDLLTYFDECVEFINEGRNKGGILVHCFAGMSRSATMVIAYMMAKCQTDLQEALAYVKKMRSIIRPNRGFMEQLQLYEDMGCHIDKKHNGFRMYKLNQLALRVQAGVYSGEVPSDMFAADPDSPGQDDVVYKCRKCRTSLFRKSVLLSHAIGEGESAFDWRGKQSANQRTDEDKAKSEMICKKSLFIEPVKWMAGTVENIEGKLFCPKCSSKIGSFIWYGERCPCGSWVAPAFHIQNSKVDEVTPRPAIKIAQPRPLVNQQLPVMHVPGPLDELEQLNDALSQTL
ncbi:dual specificity protein phosphatase 12-like [Haliotis cracherodii]|uniref:dual specificity protein phosphatase 12-like n=1 Tax=Haliotis cracherodii TaxID=6455 RepID=UPI0039E878FE